eukprot:256986-Chlamydomonas_euryale.AAC.1
MVHSKTGARGKTGFHTPGAPAFLSSQLALSPLPPARFVYFLGWVVRARAAIGHRDSETAARKHLYIHTMYTIHTPIHPAPHEILMIQHMNRDAHRYSRGKSKHSLKIRVKP